MSRRTLTLGLLLAGGVPALVYLATVAPTVYGLDSAELTAGAAVLGLVHAPGAPTFMLVGHLFTWLPAGDVGYRVNLVSVCTGAISAALLCAVVRRLTGDLGVAVGAAWVFAFGYYVWATALMAELYAPHLAFVALLLWLALRWRDRPDPRRLHAFALATGLGLGNHLALVVLAPGFAWLLFADARPRMATLVRAAGWGLLGSSVYAYLPLRAAAHPALDYARAAGVDVATWDGFWWMVSARMFAGLFFGVPSHLVPGHLIVYVDDLWSNFLGLGAILGVLGIREGLRRDPHVHVALLLMFIGHLAFMVTYAVADRSLMLGPTYLVWAIWLALGAQAAWRWLATRVGGLPSRGARWLVVGLGVTALLVNWQRVDLSDDWSAHRRGEMLLRVLPADSVYLGTWIDEPILQYFQIVEARRPDLRLVNLFLVGGRRDAVARHHLAAGRQVYTSAPGLLDSRRWRFEPLRGCACSAVLPKGGFQLDGGRRVR